jgi:flavodoxin-like protein
MRTVIVYESMFGNTRQIAQAIAGGFGPGADVTVLGVAEADPSVLDGASLLVIGGPTHAWSMSRPGTRKGAPSYATKSGRDLVLEPGADTGPGVREWLASIGHVEVRAAAFDTRLKAPAALTGRASRAINRGLRRCGLRVVAGPESFLVDKKSHLLPGETERARAWGARLATMVERLGVTRA